MNLKQFNIIVKQKIYKSALENAPIGYAYHRIILDKEGRPIDFEILDTNTLFEEYTGLDFQNVRGKRFSHIKTDLHKALNDFISIFGDVAINGVIREFEQFFEKRNKWYNIKVISPEKHYFITYLTDISAENQLVYDAEKLLQYSTEDIEYKKIAETFLNISGAKYSALNKYDAKNKAFTTIAFAGNEEDIEQAEKMFGFSITGKSWLYYPKEKREVSRNIITRFSSLNEFITVAASGVSQKNIQTITKKIEKEFNIDSVIVVKIMKNDFIIGSLILLMPKGKYLNNPEIVKLCARQTGLLLAHKQEEEFLKDHIRQYEALLKSNLTGIMVIEKHSKEILLANDTVAKLLGLNSADEVLKLSPLAFIHPEDKERVIGILEKDIFEKNLSKTIDFKAITKQGQLLWLRVFGAQINYKEKTAGLISFFDITERKLAEEALHSKNKLLTTLNNYSMELTSVSISGDIFPIAAKKLKKFSNAIGVVISYFNNATSELVVSYNTLSDSANNKLKQIIGREINGLRIKVTPEQYNQMLKEKLAYKDSLTETTFGTIPKSLSVIIKKIFKYQWFGGLTLIYKNQLVGTMVVVGGKDSIKLEKDVLKTFSNITANALQRWFVEKSLLESEKKYRFITENTVDVIWMMDLNMNYTFVSPSVKKILGYTVEEFMNKPLDKFVTKDSLKTLYATFKSEMNLEKEGKTNKERIKTIQFEAFNRDGSKIWMEATVSFYRDNEGKPIGIIGVSRDITEQKLAEKKLRESEEKFRNLAEKSPFAIMIYQKNRFVYSNQAGEVISGYTKEELYNMNYWDFTHPDYKELIKQRGQQRQEGSLNITTYDFKIIRKDGQIKWVTLTGSLINYYGKPAGLISVIDITERKKAEEELKRSELQFKMLMEELPDLVMIHQAGKIVYANKATLNSIGLPKDKFLETHILDYVAEEHKEIVTENIKRRAAGEKIKDYEIDIITSSGERRNAIIRTTDIIFEKKPSILVIIVDITEQKSAQKLQQEIAVAKQSAKFKQNFLANMSHEIRTPLTGIMGMSDFLSKTKLDTKQHDYLNTIKHSAENLREIIDLILDYSKIEAGETQIKRTVFSIKTLFENIEKLFKSICKKDIELKINISEQLPEYINTDQHRLNQVLNNLLSNAVKYTNKGKITINAFPVDQQNQEDTVTSKDQIKIKIEVKDTGIGIKAELQNRLFKPFAQIEQEDTRNYEGTGLGLAICKELTSMLGGEIGVDSMPGKGSTFWFTFSALKTDSGSKKALNLKEDEVKHSKSLNILLAEDKKVTQKVVSLMLESKGHKITIAENGKEALKALKSGNYDLVLMDIQMPVMDGITATMKIKDKFKNAPPIVGLSANAFEGDREKYMEQGMDEYLTKPVKIEDFNVVLKKLHLL